MARAADRPHPDTVRLEQARLLRTASSGSARLVLLIIANAAFLMAVAGFWRLALVWVVVSCALVGLTRLHARFRLPGAALTTSTAGAYIVGHIALSVLTGLVWSGFGILTADPSSELQVMIAAMVLTSISLGGVLPGSPHRGDYIAMASAAILPFSLWLIATADAPIRYFGVGMILLYLVLLGVSRKVHHQTVERIIARIRQKDAIAERAMVASIGHDLAQPLLAQRNYLEVLRRTSKAAADADIFRKIDQAQASQEYLIGMLTEYERVLRDGFKPRVERVDIVALVTRIVEEAVPDDPGVSPTIAVSTAPSKAVISTDKELVANALRNVISNAVKFTPPDGMVDVSVKQTSGGVVLAVADTGIGIQEADQTRVFEPYVRIAEQPGVVGLGLGLSSVRRQFDLLGGTVSLSSTPGIGTTVRLSVPDAMED